eukprot:2135810-Pyramimonas_sp.AAC.1
MGWWGLAKRGQFEGDSEEYLRNKFIRANVRERPVISTRPRATGATLASLISTTSVLLLLHVQLLIACPAVAPPPPPPPPPPPRPSRRGRACLARDRGGS